MKYFKKNWMLYLFALPVVLWIFIFVIYPFSMNFIISMQNYSVDLGLKNSEFVGFANYVEFFGNAEWTSLLWNTMSLNVLILVTSFPAAIFLAILLYESNSKFLKSLTQTATFLPFFISAVVVTGVVIEFLKADTGMIVNILVFFGFERQALLSNPSYFRIIYALMELWQTLGYNTLIYYAALQAIDHTLFEAARIDGASKIKQIQHITLPSISSIVIITFLLKVGRILQLGYEKVLLLQNSGNLEVSEIISTYVYNYSLAPRVGLPNYGVGAVVGIFDAVVAIILIVIANKLAKRYSESKLF